MKGMLRKVKVFLDDYDIINVGKNNKMLIFLSAILFVGMIAGSLTINSISIETAHKLDFLFSSDFNERISQSSLDVFVSSLSTSAFFVLGIEIVALSFWGAMLAPSIILFKGLGLGLTAGYLYLMYGLKGVAFYILILLPGIFISSIGLILFSVDAVKFSCKFAGKVLPKSNDARLWNDLITHLKKAGYSLVVLAFAALIDMAFMAMFSRFFEF